MTAAPQAHISHFSIMSHISIFKFPAFSFQLSLTALASVTELSPPQTLTDCNHLTTLQEESSSSTQLLQPLSPAFGCCPNYFLPTNLRRILFYPEINSGQQFFGQALCCRKSCSNPSHMPKPADSYGRRGKFLISRGDPPPALFHFSSSSWNRFPRGPRAAQPPLEPSERRRKQRPSRSLGNGLSRTVTLQRDM